MLHRWGSARNPVFSVARGDPWRQVKADTRKKATRKTQCLSHPKLGPMKAWVLEFSILAARLYPCSCLYCLYTCTVATCHASNYLHTVVKIRRNREVWSLDRIEFIMGLKNQAVSLATRVCSNQFFRSSFSDFSSMSCLALWS